MGPDKEVLSLRLSYLLCKSRIFKICKVSGIFGGFRGWLFNSTTELLAHDIRYDFYKEVLNKDIPFFDKNRSGDLSKHLKI